ncbi:MAG: META domain-containing protein [bacterium]
MKHPENSAFGRCWRGLPSTGAKHRPSHPGKLNPRLGAAAGIAAALLGLLLCSCDSNEEENGNTTSLAGTAWALESFSIGGADVAPVTGSVITLAFDDHGTAHGSSGCNSYSGTYTATGPGTISFANIVSTEMYCLSPAGVSTQEGLYLSMLGNASSFTTGGGRLRITCRDGSGLVYVAGGE